jgi:hypothetical protein
VEDRFGGTPFTLEQARAAGISRGYLRSDRYRRLFREVFVASTVKVTPRLRAQAALLVVPDGVLSHHTAAVLSGACAPPCDEVHVSVLRERRVTRPRITGVTVHEMKHLDSAVHEGLQVTVPGRTFVDLAPHLELSELVATGDALVRRTATTAVLLAERADAFTGRGARLARQAAGYLRAGVDSPMESRLRMLLILAGLAEPLVNTDVMFEAGGWLGRPDLQYAAQKIAIEYDGRHHVDNSSQWRRDIARRESYAREGWLVRVVTAADIYKKAPTLLGRIHEDLAERGHPGVPAQLDLDNLPSFATRPAADALSPASAEPRGLPLDS